MHAIQIPAARNTDPRASHEADDYMNTSGKKAFQQRTAVAAVDRHPGCTALELGKRTGLCRFMLGRRLPEAERAGLVKRGDERRCTVSGRLAAVWWPANHAVQMELVA